MSEMVSPDPAAAAYPGMQLMASNANSLFYRARGPSVDLHIVPSREGTKLAFCGQILSRPGFDTDSAELNVELLDHLGLVSSAVPNREGVFRFTGLSCGVYHMRVSNADWKIGIFHITA